MADLYLETIGVNNEPLITLDASIVMGSNKITSSYTASNATDLVKYSLLNKNANKIYATTADYTILDTDGYKYIVVDGRTQSKNIILPTLADNQGREIIITSQYGAGYIVVYGEGAETIEGYAYQILMSQYDFIHLLATPLCWQILSCRCQYNTGWLLMSTKTNRHWGTMYVPYDGPSGTLLWGEKVVEETSGNYGYVQSVGATPLVIYGCSGTGFSTDNKKWTGQTSGAFVVANGSSKNVDAFVHHYLSRSYHDISINLYYNGTNPADDSNALLIPCVDEGGNIGLQVYPSDTMSVKIQTGSGGVTKLLDDGTTNTMSGAGDGYYKIIVTFQK